MFEQSSCSKVNHGNHEYFFSLVTPFNYNFPILFIRVEYVRQYFVFIFKKIEFAAYFYLMVVEMKAVVIFGEDSFPINSHI